MYLLDTNACIALINNTVPAVRTRFEKAVVADAKVYVSAVIAFELWYGVGKSAPGESNSRAVATFLTGRVSFLPFDFEDAKVAGRVRAALEVMGKPIGAYDVLIAGQALRHSVTLVTANVREFSRVKGLKWEDWAKG
jgi:tRNA(fMet)-specific endonuclease VapC